MPKLPRVSGRRLARALERAGFTIVRIRGSHATMLSEDGRFVATVPLTGQVLPPGTIASVLRQAGLTVDDLLRLLD